MIKALSHYNYINTKKKEDIIANREWAQRLEIPPIPKFIKVDIKQNSPGWYNFFKVLMP